MNMLELTTAAKTIIRQAQRDLAALAPDSPGAIEHVVKCCWSDSTTVAAAVAAEAVWISETSLRGEVK